MSLAARRFGDLTAMLYLQGYSGSEILPRTCARSCAFARGHRYNVFAPKWPGECSQLIERQSPEGRDCRAIDSFGHI